MVDQDPVQPDPEQPDPSPPIPQQWHDLWDAIKREAKDTDEAIHKLGVEVAHQLDIAKANATGG